MWAVFRKGTSRGRGTIFAILLAQVCRVYLGANCASDVAGGY